jgi:putative serine protease PepD
VEGNGPFNFGDFPDDPDETAADDEISRPTWLPPEDRLWRHPSEVAQFGHPQGGLPTPSLALRPARRDRRFAVTVGAVGLAALAAAAVVALTQSGSPGVVDPPQKLTTAFDTSLTTEPAVTASVVVKMVANLRPSLVAIGSATGRSAARMTGVVLPGGALAVTAASAVGQAGHVEIVTSSGQRRRVKVLGRDVHSGIAVISTGGGLTPASFDNGSVQAGDLAIAACLCVSASTLSDPPTATGVVGEVRKVGSSASVGGTDGLVDTIEANMPLGPSPWGGVLMNGQGQVVGVLDAHEGTSTSGSGVFVPAALAVAVANELATLHKVEHGWLGITCSDVPDEGGARITAIMTGSPAASAGLHKGDVVEAVDSEPVQSLADLQASLYTSPPGTSVQVQLVRAGQDVLSTMTLAGTPSG